EAQFGKLFAQDVEALTKLARQCREPAFMLGTRQLDDGRECFLLLLVLALSLFARLLVFALGFLASLLVFALGVLLGLVLLLAALPLVALLALPVLGLILLRLLLVGPDDALDHLLELGRRNAMLLGGVVEVKHPLHQRQPGQPLDLGLKATGTF